MTINGNFPSDESEKNISTNEIKCVKWKTVAEWIDECIAITSAENVRIILFQFRDSIYKMIGEYINEMENEITEAISKYPLAAKEIYNNYVKTIDNIGENTIIEIANKLNDKLINKLSVDSKREFCIKDIDSRNNHRGITLSLKDIGLFRIEFDWNLYAGFIGEDNQLNEWFYLADNTDDNRNLNKTPNFHNVNDITLSLFNDIERAKFVDECVEICNEKIECD